MSGYLEFKKGERYRVGPNPTWCGSSAVPNGAFTEGEVVTVREDGVDRTGDVVVNGSYGGREWLSPACLLPLEPAPADDVPIELVGAPLARSVALGVARQIFGPDLPPEFYAQHADYILEGKYTK